MKEIVSIIVPIYNVGRYVEKCITTIVNQTYKNIEIILIDDGSTDKSGKICDEWKEKDKRIKVIHKENEGVSIARNVGIKNATGQYFFFVDGDDYLSEDIIYNLYKSLIENNAQIAVSGHFYVTYFNKTMLYSKENYVANGEEILKRLLRFDDIYPVIWGKLYKREIFEGIEFPERKINEDAAVIYILLDRAEKITHIDKAGYYYIQREKSIVHAEYDEEKLTHIEFLEEQLHYIEKKYPSLVLYAENAFTIPLNGHTVLTYKSKLKEEHRKLKNKLRSYMPRILKNSKMSFETKVRSILIAYFGFSKIFKE